MLIRRLSIVLSVVVMLSLAACTAGPNELVGSPRVPGELAGFWLGLWHGFIAFFTFIASLFSDQIGVYEVHNSGAWYDLGFILGAMSFFGGGGGGASRRSRG